MLEMYNEEHERHRRTNKGFTVDIHGFIETWDDTMNIYITLSHTLQKQRLETKRVLNMFRSKHV